MNIKQRAASEKFHDSEIPSFSPIPFKQRGGRKVIISANAQPSHVKKPKPNSVLMNATAKAFYWARLLETGVVKSGSEIAEKENVEVSSVNELLRLTLLAPTIIESILAGTQPSSLNIQWFTRNSLPIDWSCQQTLINSGKKQPI